MIVLHNQKDWRLSVISMIRYDGLSASYVAALWEPHWTGMRFFSRFQCRPVASPKSRWAVCRRPWDWESRDYIPCVYSCHAVSGITTQRDLTHLTPAGSQFQSLVPLPWKQGIGLHPKRWINDAPAAIFVYVGQALCHYSTGSVSWWVTPRILPVTPRILPVNPRIRSVTPQFRPVTPRILPVTPRIRPVTRRICPVTPRIRPVTPRIRPVTPRILPVTPRIRPVTSQFRPVTPRILPVTPRIRPVTRRICPVTPRIRPVTPRILPVTPRIRPGTLRICPVTPQILSVTPRIRTVWIVASWWTPSRTCNIWPLWLTPASALSCRTKGRI